MTIEDTFAVQQVAAASWHFTYEGMIPVDVQDRFLEQAYNDAVMALRIEKSVLLIAEQAGEVVGFANFTLVNETGVSELAAIYLLPSIQGLGVGSALLQSGVERLVGLKTIELTVEKENETGKRFYKAKGFYVKEEFEEDFNGHTLQSIRMQLAVS